MKVNEKLQDDTQMFENKEYDNPSIECESNERTLRRSTRKTKPIDRLTYTHQDIKDKTSVANELIIMETISQTPEIEDHPILVMAASSDPDTLYLHQARKQTDWKEFKNAMFKETQQLIEKNTFTLTKREKVPKEIPILPAVWALRRKRRLDTGAIYKYKARLNIDGSKQIQGKHYDEK